MSKHTYVRFSGSAKDRRRAFRALARSNEGVSRYKPKGVAVLSGGKIPR